MKRTFAQIIAEELQDRGRRLFAKVPQWEAFGVEVPSRLSVEQCSSSTTALYKAALSSGICADARILDLTGGLGVDSWAFGQVAAHVTHVERNAELSALAARNFKALGMKNVTTICGDCSDNITDADIIYLDPARRSASGKKVFKLEECEPDIISMMPRLKEHAPNIIVKLSPMADLTEISRLLAPKQMHVVSVAGEVKEVIAIIDEGFEGEAEIIASNGNDRLSFTRTEEVKAVPTYPQTPGNLLGKYIFEPDPALLKAGCFNLICTRFNVIKLGRSTHLYASDGILPFGKCHLIGGILPLCNHNIKELGRRFPDACVTARNIPMTSEELAAKMGANQNGDSRIFGVTVDSYSGSGRYLLF